MIPRHLICLAASSLIASGAATGADFAVDLRWFATLEDGRAQGFVPATVAQVADLFLEFAPPAGGGPLNDYHPTWGNIDSYETSGDGSWFYATWQTTSYFGDVVVPVSLMDWFPSFIGYGGGGPGIQRVRGLLTLAADGNDWTPVFVESVYSADQYQYIWGSEEGRINPDPSSFPTLEELPWNCNGDICVPLAENPYLLPNGELRTAGFLMTSPVPELTPALQLLIGLAAAGLLGRRRQARA